MNIINMLALFTASFLVAATYEHAASFALAARAEAPDAPKAGTPGVRLAKDEKPEKAKKTAKGKGGRERHIVRETQVKTRQRNIDFDAVDITGERKTPFGSIVNQNKSDKDFDLIKIRLRWHPEMIQSTSSLETGRSN